MKKKGILYIVLLIVLIIVLIVVGLKVIFAINDFEINNINIINKTDANQLQGYLSKYYGKNVFSFQKKLFTDEVQKQFPYLKVEHIEIVFPSKIILTVSERMPLFAINYDSTYYLFDYEGFLVGSTDSNTGGDGDYSCILLEGLKFTDDNGLTSEDVGSIPKCVVENQNIKYSMEFFSILNNLTFEYTEIQIKGFFTEVEMDLDNNLTATTRYGTKLMIYDFDENTTAKVTNIMGAFTSGMASDPLSTIIIGNDLLPVLTVN